MRADRLLSLVMLLQARSQMTGRELARELDVSARTIYRDIEALQTAGVPVYGQGGHDGGYRLVDGYRTQLTGMTACEAESLFLVPALGPAAELGFGGYAAAARRKVAASLPAALLERASRMEARFRLDASSWQPSAAGARLLPALAEAVKHEYVVTIELPDGPHVGEPHGIVLELGNWYLAAREADVMTAYRIAGLSEVRLHDEHFTRDPGFDLDDFWARCR